jgi:hypothetical protein
MAVSYVICAFLLYLVFTPAGLLLGRRKKDALRLRWDPQAKSYWIRRDPPGPAPETMMHQY